MCVTVNLYYFLDCDTIDLSNAKDTAKLATESSDLPTLRCLTQKTPSLIKATFDYDETLLHIAAESGKLDAVKHLHGLGADVNAETKTDKYTPMLQAVYLGHVKIVKYFVEEAQVPIDEKNADGGTALSIAVWRGHLETVKYLVAQGADFRTPANQG